MSIKALKPKPKKYDDGMTKQAFKDSTDVNKILTRQARAGTLSHLDRFAGRYGDFTGFDFQDQQNKLAQGKSIFEQLPAEIKREFKQDPTAFFDFVNKHADDPEKLRKVLPGLARPGDQLASLNHRKAPDKGGAAAASEPSASENQTATEPDGNAGSDASAASEEG